MYDYGGTLIPTSSEPSAIAEADPRFLRDDFLEFVASVHRNVHAAVAGGDVRSVVAVTDDALRSSLLERRDEAAWTNSVERVDHTAILDATHASVDAITVRVGAMIGGRQVVEDWVFERNASAYPHLRGVIPTHCASCGAPLATDERGNCRYCATHVFGVAGDWHVANVLPPRIIDAPRGPAASDALGPEHGMEDLLAFARSVYSNVHQAVAAGRVASIHGVLTTRMRAYLESEPDDHCWGVPIQRIDSVDLIGVQRGALDVITLRIQAVTEGGPFLEDWTFERPASLPGRPGPARPSACGFCGAPIELDEKGNCTHCKTHLVGVAGDWRLARATQPSAATNPIVIRALQSRFGRVLLLLILLGALAGSIALIVALTLR